MQPNRWYIINGAVPAISPAFHSSWDVTGEAVRRIMRTRQVVESNATIQAIETDAAEVDVLICQAMTDPDQPIPAHNYTGETVKGQFGAREQNANRDLRAQIVVRALTPDGTTELAVLYGPDTAALSSEFDTVGAMTNRQFPRGGAQSLTGNVTQDHILVVEIGYHSHNTFTTSTWGQILIGADRTLADLPEDETTGGTASKGWVEFSGLLEFPSLDAFETELLTYPELHGYWRMDEASGTPLDRLHGLHLIVVTGAPTFAQTGPFTGWKGILYDGVDDFHGRIKQDVAGPDTTSYAGALTVIGFAKAGATDHVHGEGFMGWGGGETVEGGGNIGMNQMPSPAFVIEYLDETPAIDDLVGPTPDLDWHMFAGVFGSAGAKFYMEIGGTVSLQDEDTTAGMDQGYLELIDVGGTHAPTPANFGNWTTSRFAIIKKQLTLTELQALYDAAAGAGGQTLTGSLFSSTPTFNAGTVAASYDLTGTLFQSAPTFPQGTVATAGAQPLTGTLFTSAPSFPQGAVTATAALSGSLLTSTPSFPTGSVAASYALAGALFTSTPTFGTGVVSAGAVTLTGSLFTSAPTFPVGILSSASSGRYQEGDLTVAYQESGLTVSSQEGSSP